MISPAVLRRRRRLLSGVSIYAVQKIEPGLVADFVNEVYRKAGSSSTFEGIFGSTTRSGLGLMTDSDGLLKWGPHNLFTNSEDLGNAAWAVTGGASKVSSGAEARAQWTATANSNFQQTVSGAFANTKLTVSAEVRSHNGGADQAFRLKLTHAGVLDYFSSTLNATSEWQTFSFTTTFGASAGTGAISGLSVTSALSAADLDVRGLRLYRSDLGGMVNNPDTGTSYVPTTSAARYLARRGNHTYNGSAWVNQGILHESASAVQLLAATQDFNNASVWAKDASTGTILTNATGPDGKTSACTFIDNSGTGTGSVSLSYVATVATTTAYTFSIFAKEDQLSFLGIRTLSFTTGDGFSMFNIGTASVTTQAASHTARTENIGNGWCRCSITFTTDAADTSGQILLYVAGSDTLPTTPTVDLDGTSSILIYGAQLEAGSVPTSYIPNLAGSGTVTRASDTLTIAGADMPWPTPNVIGPELVTNGGFATDLTGWATTGSTAGYEPTWVSDNGGAVRIIRDGSGSGRITQSAVLTFGRVYQLTFDVVSSTNGLVSAVVNNVAAAAMTVGAKSYVFVADRADLTLRTNGTATTVLDNVSIREIDPLAVSIQMDGTMTYADTGTSTQAILSRWDAGGEVNAINAWLRTDSTRTGEIEWRQSASNVLDTVTTSTTAYSPGINVPFNIASRHGSTFVNGAVAGVALTANTTPVALPGLSSTAFNLGNIYTGNIGKLRVWATDLGDTGIAEATK